MLRYSWPLFLLVGVVEAQTPQTFTNLPVVCTEQKNLSNQPISACSYANQKFLRATETSWVRRCLSSSGCTPTTATWARFVDVPELDYIEVCTIAKLPGDPINGGTCKLPNNTGNWSGMKYVAKSAVNVLPPALPPAVFEATPTSGVSPLEVEVAWNIPGLVGNTPCIADGYPSWAGAKTAVGKEEFTLHENASFSLTCADVTTTHILLSWTAPTQNTDGTPLTNLSYYTINYGDTYVDLKPALDESIQVDYRSSHYIMENMKPGTWHFGMKAVNALGTASALSNIVSYTIKAVTTAPVPRFSATRHVTVTVEPSPPSGLGVVEPKAFSLHQEPNQLTVREFGYVPVGTACDPKQAAMGLYLVKREATTPAEGQTLPPVALAKCEYDSKAQQTVWKSDQPLP